jgi:hypothetical protein
MFTLLKNLNFKVATAEVPAFVFAFGTTELFFKFHSFSLECLGFLTLWGGISAAISYFTNEKRT